MAKKEIKELKPKIKEVGDMTEVNKELINIAKDIQDTTSAHSVKSDDSDTFFRSIVNSLNSKEDISTKTEYIGVRENFFGIKATFFGRKCNIPFLEDFIEIFEEKRVSLDRKGRKEILMALQERRQELEHQRMNNLSKMFNV